VGQDDPAHQLHDFNPGFNPFPSGLFWIKAIRPDQAHVADDQTASLHVDDMDVEDYHDLINALLDGPEQDASVSFDVRWSGSTGAFDSSTSDFAFEGVQTAATIEWSGHNASGFTFHSNPASTSKSSFAIIGRERNGVFR
jgi:hypothetical protein